MKIIIVGGGKIGQKLAEVLSAESDNDVTLIDVRQSVITDTVGQFDVMGIIGSGVNLDILNEAGITDADLLIAVTGSDEMNLLSCLMAKKSGNCKTIARVRKPEYSKALNVF